MNGSGLSNGKAERQGKKSEKQSAKQSEKRSRKPRQKVEAKPEQTVELPEEISAILAGVQSSPTDTGPIETAPIETAPIETVPIEAAPVQTVSVEPSLAKTIPADPLPSAQMPPARAPVNLQTIGNAVGSYTLKSFEQTSSFFEQLAGARSFNKAFELQTQYARQAFETFVAESEKIRELHREMTRQRWQRLEGLVTGTKTRAR